MFIGGVRTVTSSRLDLYRTEPELLFLGAYWSTSEKLVNGFDIETLGIVVTDPFLELAIILSARPLEHSEHILVTRHTATVLGRASALAAEATGAGMKVAGRLDFFHPNFVDSAIPKIVVVGELLSLDQT